jgi:hypothetical protein
MIIEERFCGPPGSGNGGYIAGRLAAIAGEPVEVTFRRRVPIAIPLRLARRSDGGVELFHADELLVKAVPAHVDVAAPAAPSFGEAIDAAKRFPRFHGHPVPRCFVCGTDRGWGDGLRIFPGPLGRDGLWAAPWIPDASLSERNDAVAAEFVWSALDCTGAFAVNEPSRGLALLGRLAARILREVRVGERTIVVGWGLGAEGRKLYPGTALFSESGELLAIACATWVLT